MDYNKLSKIVDSTKLAPVIYASKDSFLVVFLDKDNGELSYEEFNEQGAAEDFAENFEPGKAIVSPKDEFKKFRGLIQ